MEQLSYAMDVVAAITTGLRCIVTGGAVSVGEASVLVKIIPSHSRMRAGCRQKAGHHRWNPV
mgnify:CR=1 FL=1